MLDFTIFYLNLSTQNVLNIPPIGRAWVGFFICLLDTRFRTCKG